jgi:Cu/Ag efflux pump CusA
VAIEVDLRQAQRSNVRPGDVRRQAATLLEGIVVGNLFDQQKVFDVVVRAVPGARRNIDDVRALLIDTPGGGHVRLGRIADVRIRPTPQVIQRDASSRRIDVTADVSGRSLGDVQDELRTRLKQISFPLEYHAQVIDATGPRAGWMRLLGFGLAAAVAVLLLLQAAFRRWRLAAVTLVSLPVALVGAEVAGVVDGEMSLGALAGLLTVGAIAARNSVAFVTHADGLQERERQAFGPELVRRVARERLGPVLATAVATALALLPFLVLGDRAGYELAQPLAIAVLGGLVTSTALSLLLVPALYARFGGPVAPRIDDQLGLRRDWDEIEQEAGRPEPSPAGGDGAARTEGNGAGRPGHVGAGVDAEEEGR